MTTVIHARWPRCRLKAALGVMLLAAPLALAIPAAAEEPSSPGEDLSEAGSGATPEANPPKSSAGDETVPAPVARFLNRAKVRRYIESIEPRDWLQRFGRVEVESRR